MVDETLDNPAPQATSGPDWLVFAAMAVALGLLGYIYFDGLELMVKWWERDEYSHGYMIPFVALYMIWQKQENLAATSAQGSWWGMAVILVGLVIFVMGEFGSLYVIVQYGFLVALYGFFITVLGVRSALAIWAALAYLIFMVPLPNFLYNNLSNELQLISSQLGVMVVRWFDISVYLEGNVIDLGVYKLQVVEACSGLRYLFPLMSFGFLISYLYRGPFWHQALLFLSTIPITVLMNSFRIGVIGVTVDYWGIEMAEGFLHDFEGWVIFMGCIGVLVVEMLILHWFSGSKMKVWDRIDLDGPSEIISLSKLPLTIGQQKPLIASCVLLIVAAAGLHSLGDRATPALERKSFDQFPLYQRSWIGREKAIEEKVLGVLKLTDYIQANFYERGSNIPVNFYVAYYDSQSKGASIHSPKSCLPGGGWILSQMSEKPIPGVLKPDGQPLVVNRALMRQGEAAQLVYYWFEQRGRNITSEYAAKWYMFVDAIQMNRTDGALLRVVVPVIDIRDLEKMEAKANRFLQEFYPLMPDYIPGKQAEFVSQ